MSRVRGVSVSVVLSLILLTLLLGACDRPDDVLKEEQQALEDNQAVLMKNQPAPRLTYSLERENLIKRKNRFNDPNKVSYLYELTQNGQIITFYVIKGKVSSVNSWLTTSEKITCPYTDSCVTTEAPDEDGSYGTNGDAIFFFTTDDVYIEWNGLYQLSDEPLQMSSPPLLTETEKETVPISDTAK